MVKAERLQEIIDAYVLSEVGAEIVRDFNVEYGPIAGMYFDPIEGVVRYELVTKPQDYVPEKRFRLYDYIEQKNKNRLVIRATDGTLYIIRPIESEYALRLDASYGPDEETKRKIRLSLMPSPDYNPEEADTKPTELSPE